MADDNDNEQRIAELERQRAEADRELAELRGGQPRPLTLAEIRGMSKEEVDREWERVKQTLGSAREDGAEEPYGLQRLRAAASGGSRGA